MWWSKGLYTETKTPDRDVITSQKQLQWIPNLRYETMKLVQDNTGENLDGLVYSDAFLNTISEVWNTTDKLDSIIIKTFYSEKVNAISRKR